MNKIICFLSMILLSTAVNAASEGWTNIFTKDGVTWEVRNNSLGAAKTAAEEPIFTIDIRAIEGANVTLMTAYVRVQDCVAKRGKLVFVNMSGSFLFENDFMADGGTIASDIATTVCKAGLDAVNAYQNKSKSITKKETI